MQRAQVGSQVVSVRSPVRHAVTKKKETSYSLESCSGLCFLTPQCFNILKAISRSWVDAIVLLNSKVGAPQMNPVRDINLGRKSRVV